MKTALDQTGAPIEAESGAPEQAICPHCGGMVTLRRRSNHRSSGNMSHFWRHQDHDNAGCPARFVVGARINTRIGQQLTPQRHD